MINSILQDQETNTQVSDQRRNSASSTEKSLNALLKHVKDQKSDHDPGMPQLDDKLYYTLRSTDATPATFYGLPTIQKPDVPRRPITSSIDCPTNRFASTCLPSCHLYNTTNTLLTTASTSSRKFLLTASTSRRSCFL